jgi:hypothetical protein
MTIYSYNFSQSLSEILGIGFEEIPELSDQAMKEIKPDFPGEYRPYGGGFGTGFKHTDEWKEDRRIAMSGENNPMYGKTHSDEVKKRLSEFRKGKPSGLRGRKMSEEAKQKLRKPKTEEHKAKRKETYVYLSPEGQLVTIFGLNEFCKQNNLSKGAMSLVRSGKRQHHKGWKRA